MAAGLLENIQDHLPQDYATFDKIDDLAKKFGEQVASRLSFPSPQKLSDDEAYDLIYRGVVDLSRQLGGDLDKLYQKLQASLELEHTPRVNVQHDLTQQNDNLAQSQIMGRKAAPWLKNADIAADPNHRNQALVDAARNVSQNPARFEDNLKNAVRAEITYQLALKMKMGMAPRPSASNRKELEYVPPPPKPRPY